MFPCRGSITFLICSVTADLPLRVSAILKNKHFYEHRSNIKVTPIKLEYTLFRDQKLDVTKIFKCLLIYKPL